MAPNLTPKQKKIFDYIEKQIRKNGFAPSQTEIAQAFGFKSLGTVQNYLVRLERQGLLRKTWNARRGVEPMVPPPPPPPTVLIPNLRSNVRDLPLLGRVAAGKPIETITVPETIEIPASLTLKSGDHFVLRVSGQSMIEDGILNDDYVVIKKQNHAQNGQTVVALVNQEATIKRYYRREGKIELHPANPAFQPFVFDTNDEDRDFRIEGILTGVLRKVKT